MKKMIVFATAATLIFAGCSKSEDDSVMTKLPNELGISIKNVTTKGLTGGEVTSFTDKSVNIFIEGVNQGTYTSKTAPYTLTNSIWTGPAANADKIMLTGNDANVYGFYPADASFDLASKTMTCAVPADQDFSAGNATDYMYSTGAANDVSPAFTPSVVSAKTPNSSLAQLYLHHALSKVCFVINKSEFYPSNTDAGIVTKIKIVSGSSKFSTAGTMNVMTGAYTSTTVTDTLKLAGTAHATEFTSIAADPKTATPQAFGLFAPLADLSDIQVTFTIDGTDLTTTLTTSTVNSWLPGNQYVYSITVAPKEINLNCQIVPWIISTQDLGSIE